MQVAPLPNAAHSVDVTANVVRALVLYSLAEVQAGNGSAIRVHASGREFSVADDGRGHAVTRSVAGIPYLSFVYNHLNYPFSSATEAPIQLHTIGLSFINPLCSRLTVKAQTREHLVHVTYRDGGLVAETSTPCKSEVTGNVLSGELSSRFQLGALDVAALQAWLQSVAAVHPGVKVYLNDRPVEPAA